MADPQVRHEKLISRPYHSIVWSVIYNLAMGSSREHAQHRQACSCNDGVDVYSECFEAAEKGKEHCGRAASHGDLQAVQITEGLGSF